MKKYSALYFTVLLFLLYSCYKESYIPVEANFKTSFKNLDESIPVYIEIENFSKGADTYEWLFEGGTPSSSNEKNPGDVFYSQPGIYKIKLIVENVDGEKDVFETPTGKILKENGFGGTPTILLNTDNEVKILFNPNQ